MRWTKEFTRVCGQKVVLNETRIYIYQWNTGKQKNFMVEDLDAKIGEKHIYTIPGKGDEAMQAAIELAKKIERERKR